jgi:predicted ATPase
MWLLLINNPKYWERVFIGDFFASVVGDSPAVIYLEDIHWADDGSLDLIMHITERCAKSPLMMLSQKAAH